MSPALVFAVNGSQIPLVSAGVSMLKMNPLSGLASYCPSLTGNSIVTSSAISSAGLSFGENATANMANNRQNRLTIQAAPLPAIRNLIRRRILCGAMHPKKTTTKT